MSKFNNKEKKPVTKDPRFASVHNDPRFLRPKKKDMKVTIDKRFASMMNSTEFSDAPRVDKYGRKLKQDTAEKQLKRYYKLEHEEEDESEEDKTLEELEKELAEDEENILDEKLAAGYDPMRGRGEISSSESDDESDDEEDLESEPDELDSIQRIQEGDETSRLALVNMDWDKIKAVDILKALNGFKPDTGIIKSVTIYPSEFGKERLASEEIHGPPKDIFKKKEESEDEDEDDNEVTEETIIKNQLEEGDGRDFDQEALRKYQLDRLKYYYAVIKCDSAQTAKVIYKSCDNTEYESSANFFDLRYIPEDMTFDDEPKDKATVVPDNYTPTKFTTEALQRTKVTLTWDEDDVDRYHVTRRDFTQEDLKDLDFDAYLASSDEEEEEENVDMLREKYRKLLESNNGNAYADKADSEEEEGDMEITFTPGLSEAAGAAVKSKQEQDDDEENKDETSIEKYMRKVKEKKRAKKASKQQPSKQEEEESDIDGEAENDAYFKEAMSEMAAEGFVDTDKNDKKKKKRASKEEREQKARERAELELLMGEDGENEGFNMKEVLKKEKMEKKKNKKNKGKKEDQTEDEFNIDVNDPRFAAIQDSHHFAIDPTNPHFKKTKSMQKLLDARHAKMKQDNKDKDEWKKEKNKPAKDNKSSLQQLVASVKRKGALNSNTGSGKRQKN
ncbi:hypothetical protein G6F37_002975 [Rhizopus arrhizus]|nr:hypothetical protein G6F38_003665 [Rhizopus arrhizus]KAG1161552.1 hypothetical protein G6F37_002975 [Rhizopus arrhizus]